MGAKPIEFRQSRVAWLALLACAVLSLAPSRLSAATAAPATQDLRGRTATQKSVSTAAVSSVEWTASDFVAIGLMVLGAAVVFIPMPKLRSRKVAPAPAESAEAAVSPIAVPNRAESKPGTMDTAKSLVKSGINPTPVSS